MKEQITCQIRWGHKFHQGEHIGRISIHADVPMAYWPADLPEPTYQSTTSTWNEATKSPEPAQPWSKWTPVENFYQPQWMREMPQGVQRYRLWNSYTRALFEHLWQQWEPMATPEPHLLRLPESTVDNPVRVQLPNREAMLQAIGYDKQPNN